MTDEFLHTRFRFYEKVREWGIEDTDGPQLLATLLGYKDFGELYRHGGQDDDVRTIRLLLGDQGWVIYKMLKARMSHA